MKIKLNGTKVDYKADEKIQKAFAEIKDIIARYDNRTIDFEDVIIIAKDLISISIKMMDVAMSRCKF